MKKVILCIIVFLLNTVLCNAHGTQLAVKSDIRAYIDYTPICSYNIEGNTYVIAEELTEYGFNVTWDGEERTLSIYRKTLATPVYSRELHSSDTDPVQTMYKIFPTDIKVFLDGAGINGFNIGGRTVVQIDELGKYGGLSWDAESRRISAVIFEKEIEGLYSKAENKVVADNYTGQVNEKGEPHGIGYLKNAEYAGSAGVSYVKIEEICGYFENGSIKGEAFIKNQLSAGKTGEDISAIFIGRVNIAEKTGENNFGGISLPYYFMKDYMGFNVFPDEMVYADGVRYEDNRYRGQSGVTFRCWYNGKDYQSILRTESDMVYFEDAEG